LVYLGKLKENKVIQNPKQTGSNLIDAVPQTGECPRDCGVNCGCECYGKGERFYLPKDVPHMPTKEEAEGKIVRVNSYRDSNDMTVEEYYSVRYADWDHMFFNTCVPKFDFPVVKKPECVTTRQAPVVYTCNGGPDNYWTPGGLIPPNVMFVRIRVNTWEVEHQDEMVAYYLEQKVPIVFTFLNYTSPVFIPNRSWNEYFQKVHVTHSYSSPTRLAMARVMERYKGKGVRMCGTPWSSLCVDCRNCEFLYWDCLRRMEE